jgi:hypothetical protein
MTRRAVLAYSGGPDASAGDDSGQRLAKGGTIAAARDRMAAG